MSVVFVRRWLVAFFIAIGIILIVVLSLRKVSALLTDELFLLTLNEAAVESTRTQYSKRCFAYDVSL